MAAREMVGASAPARTRPGAIVVALVLAVTLSLGLSLIATHSTLTRAHREAARLRTELTASRSTAVSALELRIMAAHGVSEGPFERVRNHVVAKIAEFATHRSAPGPRPAEPRTVR